MLVSSCPFLRLGRAEVTLAATPALALALAVARPPLPRELPPRRQLPPLRLRQRGFLGAPPPPLCRAAERDGLLLHQAAAAGNEGPGDALAEAAHATHPM
eukprot:9472827-Alexandrium_andersonii.AAC.1